MSKFGGEQSISMPPLSAAAIEGFSESFLAELCPEALKAPTNIDIVHLVEDVLPHYGIHVYDSRDEELGPNEAITDPAGDNEIIILIRERHYHDLLAGGRMANFARSTLGHELGHAFLHVPVMRRRMKSPLGKLLLARVERGELPAFRCSEWQAWAFAQGLLMPRRTVGMVVAPTIIKLADLYGVSAKFVKSRLKPLKMQIPEF